MEITKDIGAYNIPFPNPATVSLNVNVDEISSLTLSDINGKKIFSIKTVGKINFSVADLADGVYVLSISNSKGFARHKVLVRQ